MSQRFNEYVDEYQNVHIRDKGSSKEALNE